MAFFGDLYISEFPNQTKAHSSICTPTTFIFLLGTMMTTTLFGITSLVTHAAFVATTMTGISSANGFLIPESWKTVGKRREGVAAAATGHYYVEEYNTPECRVHMGVTPATPAATTSRGGARIEPTAILVWPVLLLWIILRDSAKLIQHSCAADGEHSKKGLTMHKRPQGLSLIHISEPTRPY